MCCVACCLEEAVYQGRKESAGEGLMYAVNIKRIVETLPLNSEFKKYSTFAEIT